MISYCKIFHSCHYTRIGSEAVLWAGPLPWVWRLGWGSSVPGVRWHRCPPRSAPALACVWRCRWAWRLRCVWGQSRAPWDTTPAGGQHPRPQRTGTALHGEGNEAGNMQTNTCECWMIFKNLSMRGLRCLLKGEIIEVWAWGSSLRALCRAM